MMKQEWKKLVKSADMNCCIPKCLLFIVGVFLGVYINHFGFVFENITVDLKINGTVYNTIAHFNQSKNFPAAENTSVVTVPNIVHFIWFGENKRMNFINYISILSVHKIHKPDVIMFHCDHLPVGSWWDKLWKDVSLEVHYRRAPTTVHGQRLLHRFHQGDVAKLEILQQYGGIYLDYDVIVINPLNSLRQYPITLGKEKPPKFIAGIILAHKKSVFLKIWYESYRNNYRPMDWDFNCARLTYQLYLKMPNLVHVEPSSLTTPDWTERHLLWDQVIDWKGLYVVHIMTHSLFGTEYNPENIKNLNSTFGEIMRYIYYHKVPL